MITMAATHFSGPYISKPWNANPEIPEGSVRFYDGALQVYNNNAWCSITVVASVDVPPPVSVQIDQLQSALKNSNNSQALAPVIESALSALNDLRLLVDISQ